MKRCTKCKRELPLSGFHRNSKNRDGRQSYCKECSNLAVSQHAERQGGFAVFSRMRTYGLTREEAEAYLQIPACQICNEQFASDTDVHFDHCHTHGHVRGVLCKNCNHCLRGTAGECLVRNERSTDYLLRDMEGRLEPA